MIFVPSSTSRSPAAFPLCDEVRIGELEGAGDLAAIALGPLGVHDRARLPDRRMANFQPSFRDG
jgi:hypothetical protein